MLKIQRLARTICLITLLAQHGSNAAPDQAPDSPSAKSPNLVINSDFRLHGGRDNQPADYQLSGDSVYRYLGDPRRDMTEWGIALESAGDGHGGVSQTVSDLDPAAGRWFRFTFRGLPEEHFSAATDGLVMKVEFLGESGKTRFDGKAKNVMPIIEQARLDLDVNGVRHVAGAAVWRTYSLDFMVPFAQVNQVRLSVSLDHGTAHAAGASAFFATDFSLVRIDAPTRDEPTTAPASTAIVLKADDKPRVIPIGGRWFYRPRDGETAVPQLFDANNVDRLLYHEGKYSTPFAGMTTAWMRAGEKDASGALVDKDRFLPDNVTIEFDDTSLILHTRGIPNHPTGKFPETGPGPHNPNYIQEQPATYYIPLDPKMNARRLITTANNSNHALPMGPIGVAVNGVVFFNPFDMGNTDAANMMDRCCGHPNQDGQYHYHKYPICINSPWSDEGTGHSPLIGFAFDGFPVYGPYEKANVMAKDIIGENALNGFNLHFDADRGWHYHVTPGKFPYIIGGYWGTEDSRDRQHPPRRGPGPGQGPPGGIRPGGPFGDPPDGGPPGGGSRRNGPPDDGPPPPGAPPR